MNTANGYPDPLVKRGRADAPFRDSVVRQSPHSGPGMLSKQTPGGVAMIPRGRGRAASVAQLPFQGVPKKEASVQKVRIIISTLGGEIPDGFTEGDDPPYLLTVGASGEIWAGISINSSGAITSRYLATGAEKPANTSTDYYETIGTFSTDENDKFHWANVRYGPIIVTICRNWFASAAPYYGVTFS